MDLEKEETQETEEDTSEVLEEEETSENLKPKEETSKEELKEVDKSLIDQNRQLYARTKKAEDRVKELEKFKELNDKNLTVDIDKIVEITSALDGLDASEKKRLQLEAKLKNISLGEAKKDEDFVLWQKSYKEKVEEEKTPPPSTKQEGGNVKLSDFMKDKRISLKEKEKELRKMGLLRDYGPPKTPARE